MEESSKEINKTDQARVALITGAGSGIGRATALALFRAGFAVVLAGRTPETLAETIAAAGVDESLALACPADVSQEEQVVRMFDQVRERYGRIDLLFNNAGISAPNLPPEEVTLEQWQAVVNVNLTGPFLCTREAIRLMKEQKPRGGRIINNGSIAATTPRPNSCAYATTKHGITGLTKASALDCRKHDIAVCQIDIGNAGTEMAYGVTQGVMQANGEVATEPTMDVEHVADSIVHMANMPLDANVLFLTIMATKMPYVGRG